MEPAESSNRMKFDFERDDSERELAIFTEALKVPLSGREAFLEQKCGSNKKLRERLNALLRAHDRLGNFLEEPPGRGEASENN